MKHTNSLIALSALCGAFAVVGCASDVGSDEVKTSRIRADIEVLANGTGDTKVTTVLREGNSSTTYLYLTGDDELTATIGENTKTLIEDETGDYHEYEAEFAGEGAEAVTVDLTRGVNDDDALGSIVTMPEPFRISFTDIDADDEVERGTDLTVEWDNEVAGRVKWSVEGDCIDSRGGETDDDGSFTIPSDEILGSGSDDESCTVTVRVSREEEGTLSSAFNTGEIVGIQRRQIDFRSVPGFSFSGGGAGGTNP